MDNAATEEMGSVPTGDSRLEKIDGGLSRRFLRSATRDLREEELDSVAARRFLIAEIERLDDEVLKLRVVADEHNDLRVNYARLQERSKNDKWLEIMSYVSSAVGAAGLGAAPSYINDSHLSSLGWVFAIGSGLLLISGVLFRVLK